MDTAELHERLSQLPIQPNPALVEQEEKRAESAQNRVADRITDFAGSMRFVYLHILWFGLWIGFGLENYPYGLLTMIVSLEAIFLSTFVMISQNRADAKRQVVANLEWKTVREEDKQNRELIDLSNQILELTKAIHASTHKKLMGVTERLARASSRHPWRVLLGWLAAIVVALGLAVALLPGNLTTNGHVTGNPESAQAERVFSRDFPPDRRGVDELIVVRSETETVGDAGTSGAFAAGLLSRGEGDGSRPSRVAARAPRADRHAVLLGIQRQADVDPLLPVVEQSDGRDGFSVAMTGEGTLDHDFNDLSQHDLKSGELEFGLPAALIVLLVVFGSRRRRADPAR